MKFCTDIVVCHPCSQLHLSHRSYTCQGFPSESHRVKIKKVVGLANLRSGMSLKRKTGIGFRHALAIVNHLNRCPACVYHYHVDGVGSGIHSILHQLLDDTGRTLYHLTSSYLVGNAIGQDLYDITHAIYYSGI